MADFRTISIGDFLPYAIARLVKRMRPSAVRATILGQDARIESGSQVVGSVFGRHSFCGYDCIVLNARIGAFCSIADHVSIGGSSHPMHFVSTSPVFLSHGDSVKVKYARHEYSDLPQTIIGNDVWIGRGAQIKSGITIGHGSVVGMGSVVTKSFGPYSVLGGSPARLLRYRFDEETVSALLELGWWNWDAEQLKENGYLFSDPEALIRKFKRS